MLKRLFSVIVLVQIVVIILGRSALLSQSKLPLMGVGGAVAGGGGGYTGPGDVKSGALLAYLLRAYNSATRGTKLIVACDASDVHCVDVLSDASTGNLTIPSSNPNCTGSTCSIKTFYDKGSLGIDLTQSTINRRYTLIANCIGSLPCARYPGTFNAGYFGGTGVTQNSPYTVSYVAQRTAAFTTRGLVLAEDISNLFFAGFKNATSTVEAFSVSSQTAAATDSAWHSVQNVFNGASSTINVDGTGTSVSVTANNLSGANIDLFNNSAVAAQLQGDATEVLFYGVAFSSSDDTAVCHNQYTYWGTSTSC